MTKTEFSIQGIYLPEVVRGTVLLCFNYKWLVIQMPHYSKVVVAEPGGGRARVPSELDTQLRLCGFTVEYLAVVENFVNGNGTAKTTIVKYSYVVT
jgi:hypothetical protein